MSTTAENKVRDVIRDIKGLENKPIESVDGIFKQIRSVLEGIMPTLIYLRAEGKDAKKMKKLTSQEEAELQKEAEKANGKTPYGTLDKTMCQSGVLKIVALLKGEDPQWNQGKKYIKMLPSGCRYRKLYDLLSKNVDNSDGGDTEDDIDAIEEVEEALEYGIRATVTYLGSRHYGTWRKKMKDRKALMTALKKLGYVHARELDKLKAELVEKTRQEKKKKQKKDLDVLKNATNPTEVVNVGVRMLENAVTLRTFKNALIALSTVKSDADGILVNSMHDVVKGKEWHKPQHPIYPVEDVERDEKIIEFVKSKYGDKISKEQDAQKLRTLLKNMNEEAHNYATKGISSFLLHINGKARLFYGKSDITIAESLDYVEDKILKCDDNGIYMVIIAGKKCKFGPVEFNNEGDVLCIPGDKVYKVVSVTVGDIRKNKGTSKLKDGFMDEGFKLALFDAAHKGDFDKIFNSVKAKAGHGVPRITKGVLEDKKIKTLEEKEAEEDKNNPPLQNHNDNNDNTQDRSDAGDDTNPQGGADDDSNNADTTEKSNAARIKELKDEIYKISKDNKLGVWHMGGNLDKIKKSADKKLQKNKEAYETDASKRKVGWGGKGFKEWKEHYSGEMNTCIENGDKSGVEKARKHLETCTQEIAEMEKEYEKLVEIRKLVGQAQALEQDKVYVDNDSDIAKYKLDDVSSIGGSAGTKQQDAQDDDKPEAGKNKNKNDEDSDSESGLPLMDLSEPDSDDDNDDVPGKNKSRFLELRNRAWDICSKNNLGIWDMSGKLDKVKDNAIREMKKIAELDNSETIDASEASKIKEKNERLKEVISLLDEAEKLEPEE